MSLRVPSLNVYRRMFCGGSTVSKLLRQSSGSAALGSLNCSEQSIEQSRVWCTGKANRAQRKQYLFPCDGTSHHTSAEQTPARVNRKAQRSAVFVQAPFTCPVEGRSRSTPVRRDLALGLKECMCGLKTLSEPPPLTFETGFASRKNARKTCAPAKTPDTRGYPGFFSS